MIKFIRYCIAYFEKKQILQVDAINSLAPKVLTKTEDLAKIQPYLNALKKTIDDPDITNIALTGGYGSGKSTIIKTFQSQHGEFKYLNLSLASFKDIKDDKETNIGVGEKGKDLERQLEVSILQQIFYHVSPSEIPDSRFKRIVNITDQKMWFFAVSLVLWIASSLIIFQSNYISKIDPQTWDTAKKFDFFAPFPFLIFFIGVGLFAKNVIRLFSNSKISKFTIKGELELGDNIDKSVFNEHLEEIIYFFERTSYNVVVIEDLDRFENTDIFTKLREINILLNNSAPVGREINFIYAIKDEMFTDKSERVKFFEYIIPVIPFINPSNAGEQLARLIKDAALNGVLSKEFTEDVVTFIDDIDMRLLTNIFHEYQLYRSNLNDDLNQDELFAMITYKNLFPDDFGELHKRKGRLYKIIAGKPDYLKDLVFEYRNKIKAIEAEIAGIKNEELDDLEELRKLYALEYFKQVPDAAAFIIGGNMVKVGQLFQQEHFENIRELTTLDYRYYHQRYSNEYNPINTTVALPFSKIESAVDENFTYDERVEKINGKIEDRQSLLKAEIQKLRQSIIDMESWDLKKVFEEVYADNYFADFSESYLIRNLLLNGYLNENYNDYISLFHAINLTKEDNTFLRLVKSGLTSPFDYKLTRLENLFKRISLKYFSRPSVLNFDLMDYMAENLDICADAYNSIIAQLAAAKEKQTVFIDSYLNKRQNYRSAFIQKIVAASKTFWDDVVQKGNFPREKMDRYLLWIFEFASVDDTIVLGTNLNQHLNKHADILSLLLPLELTKTKEILLRLKVSVELLPVPEVSTQGLFDHLYMNHSYRINAENIAVILKNKSEGYDEEQLETANYTTVSNSGCDALIAFVEANMETYVKNLVLRSGNDKEDEQTLIKMLNNPKITDGTKVALVNSQGSLIKNIVEIGSQAVRQILFSAKKIEIKWDNIFIYYLGLDEEELDETLKEYLNQRSVYETLSGQNIKALTGYDKDKLKNFFVKITRCNDLSLESYGTLMRAYGSRWYNFSFTLLDNEKVKFLINNKLISFTVKDYNTLRENFGEEFFHVTLIEDDITEYFKLMQDITIEKEELSRILVSGKIDLASKAKIITHIKDTDESLILDNPSIGRSVCNILVKVSYVPISLSLLEGLFKSSTSHEDRIKLLIMQADNYSSSDLVDLVSRLGHDYKDLFKKQHKPTFSKTEYHGQLLKLLENLELIKRFDVDTKDPNKFRVIANY